MRILSAFNLLFQGIARAALRLREAGWLRILKIPPVSPGGFASSTLSLGGVDRERRAGAVA
jgi:hypothetical protein